MKKFLSILLAVMMVLSTVSFAAPSLAGTADTAAEVPVAEVPAEESADLAAEVTDEFGTLIAEINFNETTLGNFDAGKGVKFTAQSSGASVVISGSADPAAAEYYALYPSTSGKMSTSNVFTSKVGSQQIVTARTMADDYAVMIAKAEGKNMQFKNVTALVEFTLDVK